MMSALRQQFIVSEGWFEQIKQASVIVYQCEFAKDYYDNVLFDELGVQYNNSLDRAVNKRKAEFLAGRYCAKTVLAQYDMTDFTIVADKNRAPQWPVGFKGAITHSNNNALVALSNNEAILGIGIDIESIMSDKTMNDVKSAIVLGDENNFLNHDSMSPNTVVSTIFSIKESFFKAAYPSTGFYFDFDAVQITKLDPINNCFTLKVCQALNPQIRPGMVFSGQFTFVGDQVLSFLILPK
jgi:4'-phosphopantetheinyl transferase EntD